MDPLDLNLASRPIRNNTLLWAGHGLLAALLIAASAWNVHGYVHNRDGLALLRSDVNSLEGRMANLRSRESVARRKIRNHDVKELSLQASKARDVIERKALSWTRLFNLLEKVLPYEVRMTSLRPVFPSGRRTAGEDANLPSGSVPVSVEGTARNLNAFFDFENALIFDSHFDRVEPHRFTRTSGPEVVFDLRFLYFPQGGAEVPDHGKGEAPPPPAETPAEGGADAPEARTGAAPAPGGETAQESKP
jgi:Tfp pilus assembly protein PilN